ncbi:MAG: hypothetical protein N4A71_03190 [Carboxylicivirga sp.]|jgi:hypothetical protein|nr:hypothetical protein [Carboxylicivirga sp.]MCT4646465.1 hypothetical protein [Carboxylicivirga sp.]
MHTFKRPVLYFTQLGYVFSDLQDVSDELRQVFIPLLYVLSALGHYYISSMLHCCQMGHISIAAGHISDALGHYFSGLGHIFRHLGHVSNPLGLITNLLNKTHYLSTQVYQAVRN